MEVRRAEHAGACYGVQRALDLASQAVADHERVDSLGPLIHNPEVVSSLEEQGLRVVERPEAVEGDAVVIRSHGVTPEVLRALQGCGAQVVDATCPHVARAQEAAAALAKEGDFVLVIGDESHPEVEALRAYAEAAGGTVAVVGDPESLPDELPDKVGIVVQTTQNRRVFDAILEQLRERGVEPIVRDTICSATAKRQRAAATLAEQVDAMVVIGGHNSSNTTRLFEICQLLCPRSHHIESVSELSPDLFEGCKVVGVTGGASTPEHQIMEVVDYLGRLPGAVVS